MHDYDCKEERASLPLLQVTGSVGITTSVEFLYPHTNEFKSNKLRSNTCNEDTKAVTAIYDESPAVVSLVLVRSETEDAIQTPVISNRPNQRDDPPLLSLPPTVSPPKQLSHQQQLTKVNQATSTTMTPINRESARLSSDKDESSQRLDASNHFNNNMIYENRRRYLSVEYRLSSEELLTLVHFVVSTNDTSSVLTTDAVRYCIVSMVRFGSFTILNRFKRFLYDNNHCESQKSTKQLTTKSSIYSINTSQSTLRKNTVPPRAATTTRSDNLRSVTFGRKVVGIRNYGQTCFLNSVIQALASLDPFILYLDRMVQLNVEYRNYAQISSYLSIVDGEDSRVQQLQFRTNSTTRPDSSKSFFCEDVLHLLRSVNGEQQGQSLNRCIDPRPILNAVGQKNKQFQRQYRIGVSVGEQQDAQELLQSILGMIVDEGQFELTPLAVPSTISSSYIGKNNMEADVTVDDEPSLFQREVSINPISKAMEIMMTTTSTTSPCPLSVWCGSSLMCSTCRKVRPMQNVQFLDIPVVPTSISHHMSETSRKRQELFCRLEDCLTEFISIERVLDVECKNCTIQAEIKEQNIEKEFQLQIVEGIRSRQSKRNAASNHNGDTAIDETKHVLHDLQSIHARLDYLRRLSPDDDFPIYEDDKSFSIMEEWHESPPSKQQVSVPLKRSDAFKCLLLTRLPSILSIHVQRRYFDPQTGKTSKTTQHVQFPEILDVSSFCAYGAPKHPHTTFAGTVGSNPTQSSMVATTTCTTMPIWYKLMAVIEHQGGPYSGHYVCYRRDPSSINEDRWLWISDDTVRVCKWANVRNCQAYMLFYEAT